MKLLNTLRSDNPNYAREFAVIFVVSVSVTLLSGLLLFIVNFLSSYMSLVSNPLTPMMSAFMAVVVSLYFTFPLVFGSFITLRIFSIFFNIFRMKGWGFVLIGFLVGSALSPNWLPRLDQSGMWTRWFMQFVPMMLMALLYGFATKFLVREWQQNSRVPVYSKKPRLA